MSDNKALADRLRKMADECEGSEDGDTGLPGTFLKQCSGFVYDDLTEAARIITSPQADKARGLVADDVRWVVNDIAELGVEIGGQCFFLYKGGSLVYEDCKHEDGTTMHYRPVFKREFGECCHPINYSDPTRIGAVFLGDSDAWKPLTYTTPQPQGDACGTCGETIRPDVLTGTTCPCAGATPQVSGGGEVEEALMVVNDAANEARHSGDYQRANALVRARVTLARAALSTPQARPDGGAVAWMADDGSTVSEYARAAHPSPTAFAEYTTPLYAHPAPAPDVALVGRFNELLQRMRGQLADSTADFAYPIVRDYCNELGDIFSALTATQQEAGHASK